MVTISNVTAKIILGLASIVTTGIIVYKVVYDYFVGPRATIMRTLETLVKEKVEYYTESVVTQKGALTATQEKYLENLNKRIDDLSDDVVAWGGDFSKLLQNALLGAIGVGFAYVALRYGVPEAIKARSYVRTNITNVRTSAGFEALMRSAVNISLVEAGQTSLAVAAQTSTEMWVNASLNPAMQSEIALLTAQIPSLMGTQLIWAQFMVSSLQFQMMTAIPATLTAAWVLIMPII